MYYLTDFKHFVSIFPSFAIQLTPFSINFKCFDPSFLQKLRSEWVHLFFMCCTRVPKIWWSTPPWDYSKLAWLDSTSNIWEVNIEPWLYEIQFMYNIIRLKACTCINGDTLANCQITDRNSLPKQYYWWHATRHPSTGSPHFMGLLVQQWWPIYHPIKTLGQLT